MNTIRVISGTKSPNKSQYEVLIHAVPKTTSDRKPRYIELSNPEDVSLKIITKAIFSSDLELGTVALHPRTQATTLRVTHGSDVKYRFISEYFVLPEADEIVYVNTKSSIEFRAPYLVEPIYLAPGYIFFSNGQRCRVVSGEGLYKYKLQTTDDITSEFFLSEPVTKTEEININFSQMGIGGLAKQMSALIKQVLISRIIDDKMREHYQVKDIKGILLYGPPGTGKSLIARNIGTIIPNSVIKKVNGPELTSKFYGETESNVRSIFDDARKNPKQLHVIIFDEIDAIGRKRGGTGGTHDDKVLTQLLTMIDGLDTMNNIIVIGITNRKDVLDTALLRAGRLECHIEIPLPTQAGRQEILEIYLKPLIEKELLDDSVKIENLNPLLDGYSGADIESLVGRVKNLALLRNCEIDELSIKSNKDGDPSQITMNDFNATLQEFQPTFARYNETVQQYVNNYPKYNEGIEVRVLEVLDRVTDDMKKPYVVPFSVEDRADACHLVRLLDLPYTNYVSYNDFLGQDSYTNCAMLEEAYVKCIQSDRAVLILDSLSLVGDRALNLRQTHIIETPLKSGKKLVIVRID